MKLIILALGLFSGAALAQANNCWTPWGQPVTEGFSVTAYREARPTNGAPCEPQIRTCRMGGYLDGYYQYQFCQVDYSCNDPNFGWIPSGGTVTAYLNPSETGPNQCKSEIRSCQFGRLSGSYQWRFCNHTP